MKRLFKKMAIALLLSCIFWHARVIWGLTSSLVVQEYAQRERDEAAFKGGEDAIGWFKSQHDCTPKRKPAHVH